VRTLRGRARQPSQKFGRTNAVERSKQVLQMKQIYEQAESVHIWLGPCDEQIDVFLD